MQRRWQLRLLLPLRAPSQLPQRLREVEQEDPLEFMEEDLVPVTGIIDQRTTAEGTTEYLIVWQGYTAEENTWEDAEHVLDEGLIEEYETKMAALDALDVAGLRAKIAEAPSAVDAAGAPPVDGEACTDAAAAASGLSAASVAAEATEDLATLRAMAREAYAATVQDNALHANGTKRRAPPPRRKGKFDPLKMAERAREQARRAAEKAAERERKEAERQAREAQKAAEREERDRQKEAERLKREADRKAKEEEREAERLLRMAEKEAEREVREAENAREAERKEAERMAKEAEREAKRQQLEAERLLKEAQRRRRYIHGAMPRPPPPRLSKPSIRKRMALRSRLLLSWALAATRALTEDGLFFSPPPLGLHGPRLSLSLSRLSFLSPLAPLLAPPLPLAAPGQGGRTPRRPRACRRAEAEALHLQLRRGHESRQEPPQGRRRGRGGGGLGWPAGREDGPYYVRGGKEIKPFELTAPDATLAKPLTDRSPTCPEAPDYIDALVAYLASKKADSGAKASGAPACADGLGAPSAYRGRKDAERVGRVAVRQHEDARLPRGCASRVPRNIHPRVARPGGERQGRARGLHAGAGRFC